jgi:hypothetical protein
MPASALVKSYSGVTYLFAQPARNGTGTLTFSLSGLAGKTATVVYDSDARYDPGYSELGNTFPLSSAGAFSDLFGKQGDNYQVKIYSIQ